MHGSVGVGGALDGETTLSVERVNLFDERLARYKRAECFSVDRS